MGRAPNGTLGPEMGWARNGTGPKWDARARNGMGPKWDGPKWSGPKWSGPKWRARNGGNPKIEIEKSTFFLKEERKEMSEKSTSGNVDFTIALPADCVD